MGAGRAPGEQWEEDLSDLGGSFLVSEESGRLDDVKACIGEVGDHVVRPLDGEETVLVAPDELDGNVDSVVELHRPPLPVLQPLIDGEAVEVDEQRHENAELERGPRDRGSGSVGRVVSIAARCHMSR